MLLLGVGDTTPALVLWMVVSVLRIQWVMLTDEALGICGVHVHTEEFADPCSKTPFLFFYLCPLKSDILFRSLAHSPESGYKGFIPLFSLGFSFAK